MYLGHRMHALVALTIAIDIRVRIHPITTPFGFRHFLESLFPGKVRKSLASGPSAPSVVVMNGIKCLVAHFLARLGLFLRPCC